jgi:hypothetical protein
MRGHLLWRVCAPLVLLSVLLPTSTSGASGVGMNETFSSTTWFERWGLDAPPWHTTRVDNESDGEFLRVSFPLRSFNGTSWKFPTGAADDVTLVYRIRFGTTWRPMLGQGGKLPGFGLPRYHASGKCAEACGLKPVTGPHYSARASFEQTNTGGSYVYTPQCGNQKRLVGQNNVWGGTPFLNGEWYSVRQNIVMNTPGVADGRIRAWIDDALVYDSGPKFCFRSAEHPDVHVGNAWFEMYYGGKTPPLLPMWLDLDDIRISF